AGHGDDQVDVSTQIDGGQVDDRADSAAVEVGHLPLGDREDGVPIEEVGPVLVHAGGARDDVLVHQRRAELGRRNRTERRLHRCAGVVELSGHSRRRTLPRRTSPSAPPPLGAAYGPGARTPQEYQLQTGGRASASASSFLPSSGSAVPLETKRDRFYE